MIAPYFEQLSIENPSVTFIKVDVDEAEDIAAQCGISGIFLVLFEKSWTIKIYLFKNQAMPTFQVYKGGFKEAEYIGASKAKLENLVKEFQL